MSRSVFLGLVLLVLVGGAAFGQDPGLPDSLIFGNLDGSIILASLNTDVVISVWAKTDDSVAFVHIPLGTDNDYIATRLGGQVFAPLTSWDDISFLTPNYDYPTNGISSQSILGWSDLYGGPNPMLHTNYAWVRIAEFRMHTTSDVNILGDTMETFPGANPQNGTLIFSDASGTFNWVPVTRYAKLYFPPNNPPVFNSPSSGSITVDEGFEVSYVVDCTDEDDDSMTLNVDFSGTGYTFQQLINVPGHIQYRFRWVVPQGADSTYSLTFTVDDGQGGVVDCNIDMAITRSGLVAASMTAVPGASIVMPVSLNNSGSTSSVGAFEILLGWNYEVLTLSSVTRSSRLSTWEYFNANIDDAGPGTVRVVGLANNYGGPFAPPLAPGTGTIFNLNFALSSDEGLIGATLPVVFLTQDVTDNTLADSSGYLLIHPELTDGSVRVIGPGQVTVGDINLNGIPYETGDVVLFINHLINPTMFPFTSVQIQASDINSDGIPRTVADLVLLLNIVNGNIPPPPKPDIGDALVEFSLPETGDGGFELLMNSSVPVAAVLTRIDHRGVELGAIQNQSDLQFAYHDDGQVLSVLIYDQSVSRVISGESRLLSFRALGSYQAGTIVIAEMQASDQGGRLVSSRPAVPREYALFESYPNPFNSATKIGFALAAEGRVSIDIFDINGRMVRNLLNADYKPGRYEVVWDGRDNVGSAVVSGIYFYRMKINEFSEVRKATLIK